MSTTCSKKDPITSYGIILFYIDDDEKIYYLLAQRRDTIEYSDFLRGRYTLSNLQTYFNFMTQEERLRLEKYSFEELWDDLWINHNSRFYNEIKPKARAKFEENAEIMRCLLTETHSNVIEPSWGFPKGKKNQFEDELECSFREFKEETRMIIKTTDILSISPLKEDFKGTNGKMYRTVYYLVQSQSKIPIKKMAIDSKLRKETVSEEISNLVWCTLEESRKYLVERRRKLLQEAEEKIRRRDPSS